MGTETEIHPTAVIATSAILGIGVKIGPFAVIGPHVVLGDRVEIASHAVVQGRTTIGAHSQISSFATIGMAPQDKKFEGEDTSLVCGERNAFREYCNISVGTKGGGGKTVVGSDNLFMAFTHVAHDCWIGDFCILANSVQIAGHVELQDRVIVGGCSAVHQFVKIGKMAMVGGGSMVVQDVPPFCMVNGNHASATGLNVVGIKRAGFVSAELENIRKMYKLVFQSSLTLTQSIEGIAAEIPESIYRAIFLEFLQKSTRGICR